MVGELVVRGEGTRKKEEEKKKRRRYVPALHYTTAEVAAVLTLHCDVFCAVDGRVECCGWVGLVSQGGFLWGGWWLVGLGTGEFGVWIWRGRTYCGFHK